MKNFENYIETKKKEFEKKVEIIKKYINFIEKYEMTDGLVFASDDNDYYYDIIQKTENGYTLTVEDYQDNNKISTYDLFYLPDVLIDKLDELSGSILDLDRCCEIYLDIESYQKFIENADKPFNISTWMFNEIDGMLQEDDASNQKIVNSFVFQELLFSKQPGNINNFLESVYDETTKIIKLDDKIKEKYSTVIKKFERKNAAKGFNL